MNLSDLLTQFRPFSTLIPKAKTAKTVPEIIDAVAKIPGTADLQFYLCKEMVESKLSSAVSIHKRWICFLDWFRR